MNVNTFNTLDYDNCRFVICNLNYKEASSSLFSFSLFMLSETYAYIIRPKFAVRMSGRNIQNIFWREHAHFQFLQFVK